MSGREDAFRDRIRVHDQKCVISGVMHRRPNNWTTSEAAHIFPLAKENHWIQYNYGLWIREWQKGEDGAEHKADVNDGPRILRATTYDNRFVQVEKVRTCNHPFTRKYSNGLQGPSLSEDRGS